METEQKNRRKSSDKWIIIVRIFTLFSWLLFMLALSLSYYAAPESDFGFLRYQGISVRKFWLTPLTGYLYSSLWLSALCSYLCLIIAKYRSRRATDHKKFNLILLLVISVAWVLYIVIHL